MRNRVLYVLSALVAIFMMRAGFCETGPTGIAANPDFAQIIENSPATTINVLANDFGTGLTITAITQGTHGTVAIAGDSLSLTYTPAANFLGEDHFSYTLTAPGATVGSEPRHASANVGILVVPPAGQIVALNDHALVLVNSSNNVINVLLNDLGTGLSITAVTQGTNGAVAISQDAQSLTYTPNANYLGEDHFSYTITTSVANPVGGVTTAVGQVGILVAAPPPPHPPEAHGDLIHVAKNSAATTINVLLNDEGTGLTITAVTQGEHGTVAIAGDSLSLTYTPATDYVGEDHFSYTITSSATNLTAIGYVGVVVGDPVTGGGGDGIYALPDFARIPQDAAATPIDVLANDHGTGLTVTAVSTSEHGTPAISADGLSVTYAPAAGYSGVDHFTYTIKASNAATAVGTVVVYVVNPNPGPIVRDDFIVILKNSDATSIPVLNNDLGDGLTVTAVTAPEHGSAAVGATGTDVTFTPAQDFTGGVEFNYTVTDSHGATATAEVHVLVLARISNVFASASPCELQAGGSVAFHVHVSGPNESAVLTYSWDFGDGSALSTDANPTHVYAAAGTFTATVTVTTGTTLVGTASVVIHVETPNGNPIARFSASSIVGFETVPITFDASTSSDPANTITSYAWDFGDNSAAASGVTATHTYTVAGEYHVSLVVTDDQGLSGSATHTIHILPGDRAGRFKSKAVYAVKLNLGTNAGNDTLGFDALLNVGSQTVAAGTMVSLTIAGKTYNGTLDSNLSDSTNPNVNWKLKVSSSGNSAGGVALRLRVKKDALASAFTAAGVVPGTGNAPVLVSIPANITVGTSSVDLTIPSAFLFTRDGSKVVGGGGVH